MNNLKASIQAIISFLVDIDSGAYFVQTSFLNELLTLMEEKKIDSVNNKLNSVEMWGGSGSLWESEYGMTTEQRSFFENLLLQLLLRMKEEDVLKKRAKEVLKILSKNSI